MSHGEEWKDSTSQLTWVLLAAPDAPAEAGKSFCVAPSLGDVRSGGAAGIFVGAEAHPG